MTSTIKSGLDLRVGDCIKVWWRPGTDKIVRLRPYTGPLDLGEGTMIADFALYKVGMTIEPGSDFEVVQ